MDLLTTIRSLKSKNIAVYFEKENINTLESTGEILITILSSQAQEESRNISENIRWSLRSKYEKANPLLTTTTLWDIQKVRTETAACSGGSGGCSRNFPTVPNRLQWCSN